MSFLYHINVIQGYKEADWCRHRPFMIETIFYGQIQIFVAVVTAIFSYPVGCSYLFLMLFIYLLPEKAGLLPN